MWVGALTWTLIAGWGLTRGGRAGGGGGGGALRGREGAGMVHVS